MSKPRPLSREQEELLVDYYNAGNSQQACAKTFGCSPSFANSVLISHPRTERRRVWTPQRLEALKQMYQLGISISEAARRMGTSNHVLRKYLKRLGVRLRTHEESTPRGESHYMWKGGRLVSKDGYIYLHSPSHPHKNATGYVAEHRLVMEHHLGRYLTKQEVVHHKDKNKQNNHIDNLELFASNGKHLEHELQGRVPKWSAEGRQKILQAHLRWCEQKRNGSRPKPDDRRSPS